MRLLAGTSGFSYPAWRGAFYPEKLAADEMLPFYAGRLPTVEINNSFYRMPQPALLERWAGATPDQFSFVLKAPRRITHVARLQGTDADLARLAEVSSVLGGKRGPVLFQLPPNFRIDTARLSAFLSAVGRLASDLRVAFEFRHASWFHDEVYALLRAAGACLCAAQSEDAEAVLEPTADWGYLRLRRPDYDQASLCAWAGRVRQMPWKTVHVFFKHEDTSAGPAFAEQMMAIWSDTRA